MSGHAPLPRHVDVNGVHVPALVYGTAWKEERTEPLVRAALAAGFRGIDTANQRKHYHEAGVGAALAHAFASGLVRREELFLQTKFTYVRGQDERLPYDPRAPLAEQVAQSFESSLQHLGVETLDAYLLHGPSTFPGLGEDDHETWRAMEALQRDGKVRLLGISNVTAGQLAELHEGSKVKPAIVQNRTLVHPRADEATRAYCREHGIVYEGFSLLTAIPQLVGHPVVRGVAARTGLGPAALVLRLFAELGIVPLTGTSSRAHMREDRDALEVELRDEEVAAFRALFERA